MVKRFVYVVITIALLAGIWYWYQNRSATLALDGGNVTSFDTMVSRSKSSMDSGVVTSRDLDGKFTTAAGDGGASHNDNDAPSAGSKSTSGAVNPGSASPQAVAQASPLDPAQTASGGTFVSPVPVSDTLTPNAPNGMAFGGSGKFQWYRQGNLTWRINTQNGTSCVAFATMVEWQKEIVYTHGCGNG